MRTNRYFTDEAYKEYMNAYDDFYKARLSLFKQGCPRLDSQFSESIAADYLDFTLDHPTDGDGTSSSGEIYEVKGTGYTNTKVRFNKNSNPDHIIWVKASSSKKVHVYEIDKSVLNKLDVKGFVDLKNATIIKRIFVLNF